VSGIARVRAGPIDTARATTRHRGRWAVAMCLLVIDPHVSFKFKFDRLNLKTSRFYKL
jgi:hypothetical protein